MVKARPAHEAQRLIREGQIVVNEFLEFSGLFRRAGKGVWRRWFFLVSVDVFFSGQINPCCAVGAP